MRSNPQAAIVVLLTASLVAGCGDGPISEESDWLDRPPDLGTPSDAVVVVGSGTCSMRNEGFAQVDGVFLVTERFICEDDMSDPRVTGAHEFVAVTKHIDETTGGIWTTEGATLTTGRAPGEAPRGASST